MSDSPENRGLYTYDEYEEYDLMGENSDEEDQALSALGDDKAQHVQAGSIIPRSSTGQEPRKGQPVGENTAPLAECQVEGEDREGGHGAPTGVGALKMKQNRNPKLEAAAEAAANARTAAVKAAQAAVIAATEAEERQKCFEEALIEDAMSRNSGTNPPENSYMRCGLKREAALGEATATCLLAATKMIAQTVDELEKQSVGEQADPWEVPSSDPSTNAGLARRSGDEEVGGVEAKVAAVAATTVAAKGALPTVTQANGEGFEAKHDQKTVGGAPTTSTATPKVEEESKGRRATLRPRGGTLGAACHKCGSTRPGQQKMSKQRGAKLQRAACQLVDEGVTPTSVWVCAWCIPLLKKAGFVVEAEGNVCSPSSRSPPPPPTANRVRRKRTSKVGKKPQVGDAFQVTNLPKIGSFDPEGPKVYDQLWDPAHPCGSDAVAAAVDVDNLMIDFAGVASRDKCLEILNRHHGYHAGATRHLNYLWALWESSTGTAAAKQTARARAVVEAARSRVGEDFEELLVDNPSAIRRRQVEGGIGGRDAQHADLNLSRAFSEDDASQFEDAMLEAVNDYSTPLATVFSRVQEVFRDRQLSELVDFYYRVWKKTAAYQEYKKIRRRRHTGNFSDDGKPLRTACAICRKENLGLKTCAAWGCNVAFHRKCGVKAVQTKTAAKRKRSGGKKKKKEEEDEFFCGERCWRLANPTQASSPIPTAMSCSPPRRVSTKPSLHLMAPTIEGTSKEQSSTFTESGGGDEAKEPFLAGPDRVSTPKFLPASPSACALGRAAPKDTPSRGGKGSVDDAMGETLRNLCSTSGCEEIKEAGKERMGDMVLRPEQQEQNHDDSGSKEGIDGSAATKTEREDDSASEESDENTVTDTDIEEVEDLVDIGDEGVGGMERNTDG